MILWCSLCLRLEFSSRSPVWATPTPASLMAMAVIAVRTGSAIIAIRGNSPAGTFKSKEDFLRELRGGKSAPLTPKNNPPQIDNQIEKKRKE